MGKRSFFVRLIVLLRAAERDVVAHDTSLVCAGLTLYLLTAVLPLGVVLWWVLPEGATVVGNVLVEAARAFAGEEAARWLADYLAQSARVSWQSLSFPLALSLVISLYAATNFAYYLKAHLARLWYDSARVPAAFAPLRTRLRVLVFSLALVVVLVLVYAFARGVIIAVAPQWLQESLTLTLTIVLVAVFMAVELSLAAEVPLRSPVVWRTSVLAAALMTTASVVMVAVLSVFGRGVGGVVLGPVGVMVWLWMMLWLWFVSVAVGRRLSRLSEEGKSVETARERA